MTLEGFVICGDRGPDSGRYREETCVVGRVREGGRRGERRRREEIPEENGGGCADDAAAVGSDQELRYLLRMTDEHLSTVEQIH